MTEETPSEKILNKKEPIKLIFPDPPKRLSKAKREHMKSLIVSKLKSGKFSLATKELGKCKNCPIRDSCDDFETKKGEVDRGHHKVQGCNQMRELFKHHLLALTQHEANLISDIAQIQSKLDMQEAKDSFEKIVFSPEWIKGKELAIKEMKLLQDYREKRGTRANPIPVEAEVVQFNTPEEDKKHLGKGDLYVPDTTKEEHKAKMEEEDRKAEYAQKRFGDRRGMKLDTENEKTGNGN